MLWQCHRRSRVHGTNPQVSIDVEPNTQQPPPPTPPVEADHRGALRPHHYPQAAFTFAAGRVGTAGVSRHGKGITGRRNCVVFKAGASVSPASRSVQTVCMPGKFAALCRNLSDEQKHIVRKIGLGGLLSIPSMPIQRMLVESLAENFNETDRTFSLRGHVVPISIWDVYCILGLFDKGEKIQISRKQADPTLFNLYKEKGDTAITFKYIEERIRREADKDHFTRLFMLYAIGTILAPSSKEFVGSNYLHLVADVSKIKDLNWARFTLDHLLEHLAMFKKSRRTGLAGNLAFLQVWYFEHFRATGDCFDYDLHEHPLIKNWHEAKVIKRARLEGIKKFGAEKVVIELDPNEPKVRTATNNFDQRDPDDKVEKEEVNVDGLRDANEDDESKIKDTMESVKFLLEKTNMLPEVHTIIQMLVRLADGNNKSAKCDGKQCDSTGTSKQGESHSNVHDESDKTIPASEKGKPCQEPGTDAEREFSFRTSDGLNFSSQVKRKIDFISSPTLVEKVKLRKNRQPSKVLQSPYADLKQKRVSTKKTNAASVDEVTEGLNLSESELAAITYVREQIAVAPKKNLVCIDGMNVNAGQLDCLVRPVREDGQSKWLCTWIMSSYVSMFNSEWDKDTENKKHAIAAETCLWLQQSVAKEWRQTGLPFHSVKHVLCQEFVEADMVFIPINTTNTHWWLCVLYPARNEIQILDSFNRPINYVQQTKELIIGIHLILQAGMSSLDKLKSRWSNYDILNWGVDVKKNIPRQKDACSCGIFTIKYMQYWNGSEITNPFSQKDMEKFRKKMPAEMILSPLNKLTSIKDHVNAIQNF